MRDADRRVSEFTRLLPGKLERLARALGELRKIMRRKNRFGRLQSILMLDRKLDLDQKRTCIVTLVKRLADLATWADDSIALGLNPHSHRVIRLRDRVICDRLCQAGHDLDSRQHLGSDAFTARYEGCRCWKQRPPAWPLRSPLTLTASGYQLADV